MKIETENPAISFCIPAYNCSKYIASTLKSILSQNVNEIEVIIIDDGSKDDTYAIIEEIAVDDRRVRIDRQSNSGAAATRNRCLELARAPYIWFFDADDYLYPGSIKSMLRLANSNPGYIVSAKWTKFAQTPAEEPVIWPQSIQTETDGVDWIIANWSKLPSCTYVGSFLIPMKILKSHQIKWNQALSVMDDTPFHTACILSAPGIVQSEGAIFAYRIPGADNLSSQTGRRHADSMLAAVRKSVDLLLAKDATPLSRNAGAVQYMLLYYALVLDWPEQAKQAKAEARSLGGSSIKPPGGPLRILLIRMLGAPAGLRLHKFLANFRAAVEMQARRLTRCTRQSAQ